MDGTKTRKVFSTFCTTSSETSFDFFPADPEQHRERSLHLPGGQVRIRGEEGGSDGEGRKGNVRKEEEEEVVDSGREALKGALLCRRN